MRRLLYCLMVGLVFMLILFFMQNSDSVAVFRNADTRQTLIIDAGHGGFDGGAQAPDGTAEQYINLCISNDLYALCGLFGESSIRTRTDEKALVYDAGRTIRENKTADIRARKTIAESVPNGVFLSIHLNKFDQPQYYGAQTFYSTRNEASELYAETIQNTLVLGIQNNNNRKAKPAPQTVFLTQQLNCPAVIVECGFLSNPTELDRLKETDYQKKLALCIFCGYMGAQNR